MVTPGLKHAIARLSPDCWRTSRVHDHDETEAVRWFPIVNLMECGVELGMSEHGQWLRDFGDTVTIIGPGKSAWSFFPILELPHHVFESLCERALSGLELQCGVSPANDVVSEALQSQSLKWGSLAMEWLEFLEPTEGLVSSIKFFINCKTYSQRERQKAARLLKALASPHC